MIVKEVMENLKEMDIIFQYKLHEVAKENDLTIEQLFLLIQLTENITISKTPTIGELAHSFSISPNTLSERITRLEKKELIEKMKDKDDLRISRIIVTEKGELLINKIISKTENRLLEKAIRNVDQEILKDFLRGLKEIKKGFCKK